MLIIKIIKVYEQNVNIIIMLTKCVEEDEGGKEGKVKCEYYWPKEEGDVLTFSFNSSGGGSSSSSSSNGKHVVVELVKVRDLSYYLNDNNNNKYNNNLNDDEEGDGDDNNGRENKKENNNSNNKDKDKDKDVVIFEMLISGGINGKTRVVYLVLYSGWPDMGIPKGNNYKSYYYFHQRFICLLLTLIS